MTTPGDGRAAGLPSDPSSVQDLSGSSDLPERPVDPDWLALREPADARSRDSAADAIVEPLLRRLAERLGAAGGRGAETGLRVVDLGAGTGANLRWLAPRLGALGGSGGLGEQQWALVDHDPRLRAWGPAASTTIRADVAELGQLLSGIGGADLVTAAALLDLLDGAQLAAVVDAVVAQGVPALFTLTVTGEVTLDPEDPLDAVLAAAFDAHQRREGRLGPDAVAAAAELFHHRGWAVVEAPTPWRLRPDEPELLHAWLAGRAEAAAEWRPELAPPARTWLARRDQELDGGELSAVVGHLDLLAMPPASAIDR